MKECGLKIPKTSDFITHTDVIRRFVESPERITIKDYCNAKEARSVCMLFRGYVTENELEHIRIIQRGPDIILYKVRNRHA